MTCWLAEVILAKALRCERIRNVLLSWDNLALSSLRVAFIEPQVNFGISQE